MYIYNIYIHIYRYTVYWLYRFTTGYGDITATAGNVAEQWVVSICILIGTCFFAYFIGTLTSLITEGDRIKSVEIQKLEEAQGSFYILYALYKSINNIYIFI